MATVTYPRQVRPAPEAQDLPVVFLVIQVIFLVLDIVQLSAATPTRLIPMWQLPACMATGRLV
jgi:hypothetical protein